MINVLIADDRNFVRKTLESYLAPESDLNVIGFAERRASSDRPSRKFETRRSVDGY